MVLEDLKHRYSWERRTFHLRELHIHDNSNSNYAEDYGKDLFFSILGELPVGVSFCATREQAREIRDHIDEWLKKTKGVVNNED